MATIHLCSQLPVNDIPNTLKYSLELQNDTFSTISWSHSNDILTLHLSIGIYHL